MPRIANNPKISSLRIFVPEAIINSYRNNKYYYPIINKRKLINEILGLKPDVVFCPTLQFTYKWPIPFVIMIRNMEPLVYDNKFNPIKEKIKNYGRKILSKNACLQSDGIIAVSNHVKDYIINNFNVEKDKVAKIYHGIDKSSVAFTPDSLSGNKIFTAGSIRPARGLEDLILAFSLIKNKYPRLRLLIAGKVEPGMFHYKHNLEKLIENKNLTKRIIWLDNIEKDEMIKLFKSSKVFIMTSRAEACPNIALEAMKYGNYIISTDNQPMPEFFGKGATYYCAKNHYDLATKLEKTISLNKSDLLKYKRIYKNNLNRFSWDRSANKTVSFLEQVIKR